MSLKIPITSKQKSKWSIHLRKKTSWKWCQHARMTIWRASASVPAYPPPGLLSNSWLGGAWCLGLLLLCSLDGAVGWYWLPGPAQPLWRRPQHARHTPAPGPCRALALTFSGSPLWYSRGLEKQLVDFPMTIAIVCSFQRSFGGLNLVRQ